MFYIQASKLIDTTLFIEHSWQSSVEYTACVFLTVVSSYHNCQFSIVWEAESGWVMDSLGSKRLKRKENGVGSQKARGNIDGTLCNGNVMILWERVNRDNAGIVSALNSSSSSTGVGCSVCRFMSLSRLSAVVYRNHTIYVTTICAGGRHNMPPPRASVDSGRWHINCWRRDKLRGDLNSQPKRPCDLDHWPLTLKLLSESRVTWATSVPILVFLGLSVLDSCSMYATDVRRRQTDVR